MVVIIVPSRHVPAVLRVWCFWVMVGVWWVAAPTIHASSAETSGKVRKVLPHLLDHQGQHTVSPSLFDRDAYQARLRRNPQDVSGIRYDVRWRVRHAEVETLTLRLELRGMTEPGDTRPRAITLERALEGGRSVGAWTGTELTGEDYSRFGEITAWRVSLWLGETMLDEYHSFLW